MCDCVCVYHRCVFNKNNRGLAWDCNRLLHVRLSVPQSDSTLAGSLRPTGFVLSSVLNVIYFVSVGYMVKFSEQIIRDSQQLQSPYNTSDTNLLRRRSIYLHAVRCILAGASSWQSVGDSFSCCSPFTNPKMIHKAGAYGVWFENLQQIYQLCTCPLHSRKPLLVNCFSRFCTIPLLVLSAVGWCVCAAGLYKLNEDTTTPCYQYSSTFSYRYDFGTWATYFIAPILYLAALLHAWCSNDASTMSGVFAAIFNTFFVLNVDFEVVDISIVLYAQITPSTSDSQHFNGTSLDLGGGVVCLFFWTIVYAAWNFYCFNGSRDHARLQPNTNGNDDQPQTTSHTQQNEYGDTSFVPMAKKMPPSLLLNTWKQKCNQQIN